MYRFLYALRPALHQLSVDLYRCVEWIWMAQREINQWPDKIQRNLSATSILSHSHSCSHQLKLFLYLSASYHWSWSWWRCWLRHWFFLPQTNSKCVPNSIRKCKSLESWTLWFICWKYLIEYLDEWKWCQRPTLDRYLWSWSHFEEFEWIVDWYGKEGWCFWCVSRLRWW